MDLFDDLQRAFDNREPQYYDREEYEEQRKQDLINEQIKIIEQDAEYYGDMAVDAIAEYLVNEDGIPDDITLSLKGVIFDSIQYPDDNYINAFIKAAIEWKAKQIMESENE